MKFNPFFSHSLIGLDIQPGVVHLVQLKKIRSKFCLITTASHKLPSDFLPAHENINWAALTSFLSEIVSGLKLKGQLAAVQVPFQDVRSQCIELPSGLTDNAIQAEIAAYIQRSIPNMKEAFFMDFSCVASKASGYEEIYFAAARKTYLNRYVDCIHSAGLQVKIIDIDIYALLRAVMFILKALKQTVLNPKQITAVLQQSDHKYQLIFFNTQRILFHQSWQGFDDDSFADLKNKIQIGLGICQLKELEQLVLCGVTSDVYIKKLNQALALPVFYADLAPHLQIQNTACYRPELLLSCGLAMSEAAL